MERRAFDAVATRCAPIKTGRSGRPLHFSLDFAPETSYIVNMNKWSIFKHPDGSDGSFLDRHGLNACPTATLTDLTVLTVYLLTFFGTTLALMIFWILAFVGMRAY